MECSFRMFRFDAKKDYNHYFNDLKIYVEKNTSLIDMLEIIKSNLDNYEYPHNLGIRINNIAIFNNLDMLDIINHFGTSLDIFPLSTKYAMKDLMINMDALMYSYNKKLNALTYLTHEDKEEFKQYLLINLIGPLDLEDYCGDGYCLFIKSMMKKYHSYYNELLEQIAGQEDGVMNSIPLEQMMYPTNNKYDLEIIELQKVLLQELAQPANQSHWNHIAKQIRKEFKINKLYK